MSKPTQYSADEKNSVYGASFFGHLGIDLGSINPEEPICDYVVRWKLQIPKKILDLVDEEELKECLSIVTENIQYALYKAGRKKNG